MKKLITILLLTLTLITYGQTELDKEIFRLVNEYRVSNDLKAWVWDQDVFKVAEKHNLYQVKIENISHSEPVNGDVGDRLTAGNVKWWSSGENLTSIPSDGLSITEIATYAVEVWKNSPGHNWLLLGTDTYYQYVGISSKKTTNYNYVNSSTARDWTYITLNVYK